MVINYSLSFISLRFTNSGIVREPYKMIKAGITNINIKTGFKVMLYNSALPTKTSIPKRNKVPFNLTSLLSDLWDSRKNKILVIINIISYIMRGKLASSSNSRFWQSYRDNNEWKTS